MKAIDLFAGAGGWTEGARQAGINVVYAANHWRLACEIHNANHAGIIHACQDLRQVNWSEVPTHDLMLASPACQGHSLARGKDKPHSDTTRQTAWAIVDCAEFHRPRFIFVENVLEFRKWIMFDLWETALRRLGYSLSSYELDAADHGVPQNRKRLFIFAALDKTRLQIKPSGKPQAPADSFIDWRYPKWTPIDKPGRAAATLRRVSNGRRAFGKRFLMPYYGSGSGLTGRSTRRPIGTITTVATWAVVNGAAMRMLNVNEIRAAMGFPETYELAPRRNDSIKLLGNAVCPPIAAALLQSLKHASN